MAKHNKKYISKKSKVISGTKQEKKEIANPLARISIRLSILTIILFSIVAFTDYKGYFDPDQTNNHTVKKWNAFYEFTNENNVDILLLGNSHLYTGINPKILSNTFGANSFIIASPGTNIADTYFGLKEALSRTKPKIVVIETYGINDSNPYELENAALSDQFKSFSARKNFFQKISSMPFLFTPANYLYAWSNTLRNHNDLISDIEKIQKNIEKNKKLELKQKKEKKLYLGRYVRFQTGIEDSTLTKYKNDGAPVDGEEYNYNSYADKYTSKIVDICKKNDIELMFLTLPMYKDHIKNYRIWKERLSELLNKFPNKWIDMQSPYSENEFTTDCFENTYSKNQHMTYVGSVIASYKLAEFIRAEYSINLPDHTSDANWHKMFYASEGYFEHYSPYKEDKTNKLICKNKKFRKLTLYDAVTVINKKKKNQKLMVKIRSDVYNSLIGKNIKLSLAVKILQGETESVVRIDLPRDTYHKPKDYILFTSVLKPITILDIVDAQLIQL